METFHMGEGGRRSRRHFGDLMEESTAESIPKHTECYVEKFDMQWTHFEMAYF